MQAQIDALKQKFEARFGGGGRLRVIRAPGRVNLIGEHTDYNDGFVFPMAIEPHVLIACRARDDSMVHLASTHFVKDKVLFALDREITPGKPKWANYSKGVAAELIAAGIPLVGMDAMIDNTLPVGGGLSSSAAIEVGTGLALLKLAGAQDMDRQRLALLCQKAEHEFANVPCGIMDQMIVATGEAGHAMQYDCRSGARQYVKLEKDDLRVVIVNSGVHHELMDGEYARRRKQCEAGVAYFQQLNPAVRSLRDVTIHQVDQARGRLDDLILKRCRHVVHENARTAEAAGALARANYERFGELMVQSHASLRDDYQVSCDELDFLSDQAMKIRGVYGARMTGGGFGGCIVALAQPRAVPELTRHIEESYQRVHSKTPSIYITGATAGASVVE